MTLTEQEIWSHQTTFIATGVPSSQVLTLCYRPKTCKVVLGQQQQQQHHEAESEERLISLLRCKIHIFTARRSCGATFVVRPSEEELHR